MKLVTINHLKYRWKWWY